MNNKATELKLKSQVLRILRNNKKILFGRLKLLLNYIRNGHMARLVEKRINSQA
jgi:hypothetical protein